MIRILQLDRIIFWNNDTTISTIFLCDINRRFRNPPSSIFPIHPLTNLKGISLKDRDRYQIRFQITVSAPIFHSIATRPCEATCTVLLRRFVLRRDVVAWQTRYVSRSTIVTLRSLRNGNHRRGRDSCTWLTLHYSRVQSWESFRAARERRFVRLSSGRKHAASRKGRHTHPREVTTGVITERCAGWIASDRTSKQAGNRRRIRCHVTFPYIPRRDGCIACLLDRSIPREGELVEDERFSLDISVRFSLYDIPESPLSNSITSGYFLTKIKNW